MNTFEKPCPYVFPGLSQSLSLTPEEVFNKICKTAGVEPKIIKSQCRKGKNIIIRHIYCYIARKQTQKPFCEIGNIIKRTHSSVIHSCRVVQNGIETNDKQIMKIYNKLKYTAINQSD